MKLPNWRKRTYREYALYKNYKKELTEKQKLQKYIYKSAASKGINNTALKELIKETNNQISMQYTRKTQIETRSGFLIALCGILIATLGRNVKIEDFIKITDICQILRCMTYSISVISLILSVFYAYKTLSIKNITFLDLKDQNRFFKCASDDKELFYVIELEGLNNAWKENEKLLSALADKYTKLLVCTIITTISIILYQLF